MDGPSEALGLFENKRSGKQMRFKAGSIPIENYALFSIFRLGAEGFQRGASVLPLWSGVGEAPRRWWQQAIFPNKLWGKSELQTLTV